MVASQASLFGIIKPKSRSTAKDVVSSDSKQGKECNILTDCIIEPLTRFIIWIAYFFSWLHLEAFGYGKSIFIKVPVTWWFLNMIDSVKQW